MIYIKNAEIYTPDKIIKNGCVLIEGGKIVAMHPRGVPLKPTPGVGFKVIDAKGKILCPGFIDVHLQGAGGYDVLDGTREALEGISKTLAKFGTTSFLATTVFKNGKNPHIDNIARFKGGFGANLLGIHLEGPFIDKSKKGMIRENGITSCSAGHLDKILNTSRGKLKMMTIAPELKGAIDIIKKLRKKKIIASFGHSNADFEQAQKGIKAGINHVTHLFNAMRPIHHRDPGPLPALLMDNKVSVQLISDGVHISPAIARLVVKLKGAENIILITDSMSSMGLGDGKYVYDGWNYESKNGACRYKNGTLIGTSLPLNKMLQRMVQLGGVSLLGAVRMVTINPARLLGISRKKGSITPGKDADLVIMDKDCNISNTIIAGRVFNG
ncbi:MAG: N-acetylglucosamine-6-phosphate deacetylase [Candidatus Omnitrophota bacterium]